MRKILLLLCIIFGTVTNALATEERKASFDWSDVTANKTATSYTDGQITLTFVKGTAVGRDATPMENSGYKAVTMVSGNKLTIAGADESVAITHVEFTSTGTGYTAANLSCDGSACSDSWDVTTPAQTLTLNATGKARFSKIVVSYTSTSTKTATSTTFPAKNYTAYIGEAFTSPKATVTADGTTVSGAAVKYSSSAENVATINKTKGTLTLVATGSATIKASYAGDDNYDPSEASYTLTVGKAFKSLAELVAAGAPTSTAILTKLTLTNDKIQRFYIVESYHNGIYLKYGEQEVRITGAGVPDAWQKDDVVSGTITGHWKLNGSVWELELSPVDWSLLTCSGPMISAHDANGNVIKDKFTTKNLTVKYTLDPTGLTFKVNDEVTTYNTEKGISISVAEGSMKNDAYTISVYNGETLVAAQEYMFIPTTNVTGYKTLADGTEAIMRLTSGNKVSYASMGSAYIEDENSGIHAVSTGLAFRSYKLLTPSHIWGKKDTRNNIDVIAKCDSTVSCSYVAQSDDAISPTVLTVADALKASNQLRYVKIAGTTIVTKDGNYYASSTDDYILLYDELGTGVLAEVTSPCNADVTGITSMTSDGKYEIMPTNIEEKGMPAGISNVDADADHNGKHIVNGRLIIEKAGRKYNALGQQE